MNRGDGADGPIDARAWPTTLETHALDEGGRRLFGYDVQDDLAVHYRFSDVLFLSLVGELPSEAQSRAFEIAMIFASGLPAGDAAVHATVLSRLCGVRPSGVVSTAALLLGESALSERSGPAEVGEQDAVRNLTRLVGGLVDVTALDGGTRLEPAVREVLRACGIEGAFAITSVLAMARLPSALAEAGRTKPGAFGDYPIDTPPLRYVP